MSAVLALNSFFLWVNQKEYSAIMNKATAIIEKQTNTALTFYFTFSSVYFQSKQIAKYLTSRYLTIHNEI